jgi:hypothetical protein
MKRTWAKLGGQLGMGLAALGLLAIGLGWNGAAGLDFVSGQVPYLLSGAALGLGLVIIGVCLVIVENSRKDRAILETQLADLAGAVNRLANAVGAGVGAGTNGSPGPTQALAPGMVVVGASSFHRPDCRLAQGKHLNAMPLEAAEAEGLEPCRICNPAELAHENSQAAEPEYAAEDRSGRRPRRSRTRA